MYNPGYLYDYPLQLYLHNKSKICHIFSFKTNCYSNITGGNMIEKRKGISNHTKMVF